MTTTRPPALPSSHPPRNLTPQMVLERLDELLHELPSLLDVEKVRIMLDHAESIRFLTKKLRYDVDIQNAAAEAVLITKRRLGELLPSATTWGGDRRSSSSVKLETKDEAFERLDITPSEAYRCSLLAGVPSEEFTEHLSAAKEEGEVSTAAVLRLIKLSRRGSKSSPVFQSLPEGRFSLLLADPPWEYSFGITSKNAIENQYPTLTSEQIAALPISEIAATDAVLFLWSTSPKLSEALYVMTAWGFEYRSSMVWVKNGLGLGYYARQNHEFLLIGKRGNLPAPEPSARPPSVITAERGRHSEKPTCVYDILETMYPKSVKVELFSRTPRKGWTAWGNEVSVGNVDRQDDRFV